MGVLATLPGSMRIGAQVYSPAQLDLMWKTAAKDCNQIEFSQFIHVAGHLGLDPMRKQIYAMVFNKSDDAKRQMSIFIGIDGYRTVARRTGDYRPDDKPPRFTIDPAAIDPDVNPQGIIDCEVTAYFHSHGEWHPVPHKVEWQAYAPIIESGDEDAYEWVDTGETWPDSGKPKKRKQLKPGAVRKAKLDPSKKRWIIDGKGMLAKCAEVGAIRKAFPDNFAGVYEQAELDRAHSIDLSAAEYAEAAAVQSRLELIGGKGSILMDFCDERGLHPVPLGKLHGECEEFLQKYKEDPIAVETWRDRNQHQLREFWARAKNDALDIKKKMEAILSNQAVTA